jgi:hypothetical protein
MAMGAGEEPLRLAFEFNDLARIDEVLIIGSSQQKEPPRVAPLSKIHWIEVPLGIDG